MGHCGRRRPRGPGRPEGRRRLPPRWTAPGHRRRGKPIGKITTNTMQTHRALLSRLRLALV
eukprot:11224994-Lingulodinium_polyedra.AAC.1